MTTEAVDPRIARTRRDVAGATAALLIAHGWDGVTHAEVARSSGYSKATIYAHWPHRIDLVQSAIDKICDAADHPPSTGDFRNDLRVSLLDFASDLTDGHLDRLLAGVIERASTSDAVRRMRTRLYDTGTAALRSILREHLDVEDVDPTLALLTGGVLLRVSFEGVPATEAFIDDLVRRVLGGLARVS